MVRCFMIPSAYVNNSGRHFCLAFFLNIIFASNVGHFFSEFKKELSSGLQFCSGRRSSEAKSFKVGGKSLQSCCLARSKPHNRQAWQLNLKKLNRWRLDPFESRERRNKILLKLVSLIIVKRRCLFYECVVLLF